MRYTALTLVLGTCIMLAGCPSDKTDSLSQAGAQSAINKALGTAAATVIGVQEFPNTNSAQADVNFQDLHYVSKSTMMPTTENLAYSGSAKAQFVHYTNGTWVLTDVVLGDHPNWPTAFHNLNTPVQ